MHETDAQAADTIPSMMLCLNILASINGEYSAVPGSTQNVSKF